MIANTILTAPGKPVKRHLGQPLSNCEKIGVDLPLEFELPPDQTYNAGDYLAMWVNLFQPSPICYVDPSYDRLPVNPERDVRRVLSRFKLLGEQEVIVDTCAF